MCYLAIRVILMSSNENRGKGHVGEGTVSHGGSKGIIWYCSGVLWCTGRGVGEGDAFGRKVGCEYCLGRQNRGQGTNLQGGGAVGYGGVQNRLRNANPGQARQVAFDEEQILFLAGRQDNAINEDVDEKLVQDLALNVDNVFQVNDCDAFDSDVDEALTAQTMFMANLSSVYHVYDEASPSYDSNILSEARFKLTEREQKINEQLRIVITDSKFKEETLKRELHSVKLELASTINHNKLMVEEVTSLKRDFKQKENKYLKHFLDMKSLKEKVEGRLFKQDQSLQTVHILCRPKPYYNELNKVAIGYKNPLCLTRAKQVWHALYNGHEIIKDNHVPTIVYNIEDTLEIAEITRRKMNDNMKDQECVIIRNTPTGLTEGERGFEQTKECYLKEVIPFFKTLKEHFEGIQKALTKEIKEMKEVFEELKVEVAQNVIDKKHDEIERKNFLIANDNLIAECLSKEVFYVATISELNVARFTKMHVANTIVEARCLEFDAELSTLRDTSHNDIDNELVNRFSNVEVRHLNLPLKYQNLKDSFGNNPPTPAKDTPDFDSVFIIRKCKLPFK
nr:retrovirus-related Pol polyprotein from transposon TNT 1-94 [Tanacetum cinerariifolium]